MLVSSFGVFLKIENFDKLVAFKGKWVSKQKKIQGNLIRCHKTYGQLQCLQTAPKEEGGGGNNKSSLLYSCRRKHREVKRRREKRSSSCQGEKSTSITEKILSECVNHCYSTPRFLSTHELYGKKCAAKNLGVARCRPERSLNVLVTLTTHAWLGWNSDPQV